MGDPGANPRHYLAEPFDISGGISPGCKRSASIGLPPRRTATALDAASPDPIRVLIHEPGGTPAD